MARAWLAHLEKEDAAVVSAQVLREFYHVLTKPGRRFNVSAALARRDVEDLAAWLPQDPLDDRFEDAWAIQDRYRFSWFDSLLLAAALEAGCAGFLTEDLQNGQQIQGMRIINPFLNDPDLTLEALRAEQG